MALDGWRAQAAAEGAMRTPRDALSAASYSSDGDAGGTNGPGALGSRSSAMRELRERIQRERQQLQELETQLSHRKPATRTGRPSLAGPGSVGTLRISPDDAASRSGGAVQPKMRTPAGVAGRSVRPHAASPDCLWRPADRLLGALLLHAFARTLNPRARGARMTPIIVCLQANARKPVSVEGCGPGGVASACMPRWSASARALSLPSPAHAHAKCPGPGEQIPRSPRGDWPGGAKAPGAAAPGGGRAADAGLKDL